MEGVPGKIYCKCSCFLPGELNVFGGGGTRKGSGAGSGGHAAGCLGKAALCSGRSVLSLLRGLAAGQCGELWVQVSGAAVYPSADSL